MDYEVLYDKINPGEISNEDVSDYYVNVHPDYKKRWEREGHQSLHFGYFDEDHQDHGSANLNMKRIVADTVDIDSDDTVLDAGCGIGDSSTWIAKNRGADVIGINICEMQLGMARRNAKKRDVVDQVTFNYDDFTEMETIDDNSVDVVWAFESTCYAEDKSEFLEQAKRVLKDGGRLVVPDWYMNRVGLTDKETKWVREWLDGWEVPNYVHIDHYTEMLSDLGFEDIDVHDAHEATMPSARNLYLFSLWGYPVRKLLGKFDLQNPQRVQNAKACYYLYKAYESRVVKYNIVSATI